jgi:AcrR family transcriptional regulator
MQENTVSTGSKGEKTRANIIESANRLFYERGYEATSFTNIVDDSGILRGHIYHYFKSKDDILIAVIEHRLNEFREMLAHWDILHTTPKAKLHAFVEMIIEHQSELTEYGCPIGSLNTELGKDRRKLQLASRALLDMFRDWLTQRFAELNRSEEAEMLALHLLGRAQGIAVIVQAYQNTHLLTHETQQLAKWVDEL